MVENCKGCKYFLDVQQNIGTCRRFPHYQNRSPNEVCGEFFGKAVAEVPSTPVEDFLPTLVQIEDEFDKVYAEYKSDEAKTAKRRGRPPKEKA